MAVKRFEKKDATEEKEVVEESTKTVVVTEDDVREVKRKNTEPKVSVKETEKESHKEGTSRVRMRVDHECYIGGEWYRLKKGSCYNVPDNVKRILGEAGLLSPL